MSRTPHRALEELIAWATPEEGKGDLLEARATYFARSGEVFEDDRQLEQRMAAFLEFYVCDRPSPRFDGRTPARARYELALADGPEVAQAFRALTDTIHGLFEVRRLSDGQARLRGLFSGIDHEVTERRQIVGLLPGDVLEARLIPAGAVLHFSPAFCWHPHDAAELIKAEARRRRQQADSRTELDLLFDCANRSLKVERYRQIAIERIYDFTQHRL
jgi:hypothetical protein